MIIDKNKKPPKFRLHDNADDDNDDENEEALEDDTSLAPVSPKSKPIDQIRSPQANFTI